jgi:hypothetical protein
MIVPLTYSAWREDRHAVEASARFAHFQLGPMITAMVVSDYVVVIPSKARKKGHVIWAD